MDWILACFIGTSTALVELLSRYRDEPFGLIARSRFAWAYLALHGVLSICAHALLVQQAGLELELASAVHRTGVAIAAGLGVAVLVRARVVSAKLGDEQVAIGPGYVIEQLLRIIDAQIDRRRAIDRVRLVVALMRGKDFEAARVHACMLITGSRQSLSLQDQRRLGDQLREIAERGISDQDKAYALGFVLLDLMGEGFLLAVADQFADS
jgi:hypothetical protein